MNAKDKEMRLKFKKMADDLRKAESWCDLDGVLNRIKTMQNLYEMGYRKQSDGEWVKDAPHWRYKCNQCGFFPLMVHGDFLPYCPNCGAHMKGGAE